MSSNLGAQHLAGRLQPGLGVVQEESSESLAGVWIGQAHFSVRGLQDSVLEVDRHQRTREMHPSALALAALEVLDSFMFQSESKQQTEQPLRLTRQEMASAAAEAHQLLMWWQNQLPGNPYYIREPLRSWASCMSLCLRHSQNWDLKPELPTWLAQHRARVRVRVRVAVPASTP